MTNVNNSKEIPFDYAIAKQIAAGLVRGFIKTNNDLDVRIVCYNLHNPCYPIIGLTSYKGGEEEVRLYDSKGKCERNWTKFDLRLFIIDEGVKINNNCKYDTTRPINESYNDGSKN